MGTKIKTVGRKIDAPNKSTGEVRLFAKEYGQEAIEPWSEGNKLEIIYTRVNEVCRKLAEKLPV